MAKSTSHSAHEKSISGLAYWMARVLRECDCVAVGFEPGSVHDLRIALRRCRSIADGLMTVDSHPAWRQLKKSTRRLFRSLGALASELFPTEVRATAMGLSYNIGRGFSAAAPFIVGYVADRFGFGSAFFLLAGAFLLAALLALTLPETKGKQLE